MKKVAGYHRNTLDPPKYPLLSSAKLVYPKLDKMTYRRQA